MAKGLLPSQFIVKKIIFPNVLPLCFWVDIGAQNF
jgi:hypothetical protein